MGDEVPIKLGFKDVIFVMEDVDAASKVVQRRDGKTGVGAARVEVQIVRIWQAKMLADQWAASNNKAS